MADIYGASTGGTTYTKSSAPRQFINLGYAYIHDPQFTYSHFLTIAGEFEVGNVVAAPELWAAVDDSNQRMSLPLTYRLIGSTKDEYLNLHASLSYHNFGSSQFATTTIEGAVETKLETQRLGVSLTGGFVRLKLGLGFERTVFSANGSTLRNALPIGRFGYGVYLPRGGELELFYNHRRDGFAGGISPGRSLASGFLGHVGTGLRLPITPQSAVQLELKVGSALVCHASFQWSPIQ